MRKTYIYILICSLSLFCTSCSFLKVKTVGKNTTEAFFLEYDALVTAGNGLHRMILDFYDDQYVRYAELMGDLLNIDLVNISEGDNYLYNYEMSADLDSTYPFTLWRDGYVIVTNANNIIFYGPKLYELYPSQSAGINKVIGYAYFARALAHFCLCNCYAQPYCYTEDASHLGVPFMDHIPGMDETIKRVSVAEVYDRVIGDLNEAVRLLGTENIPNPHYISGIACEALLARVYLYKEDWENARKYSESVMGKVALSPASEYVDMFRNASSVTGTEAIFRLDEYAAGSSMAKLCDPTDVRKIYPNPTFADSFDGDDIRKELLTYIPEDCENDIYKGNTYPACCKHLYYKSITDDKKQGTDPFVLRVSEMYLIHAEALAKGHSHDLAGAVEDLKALIARARQKEVSAISLPYTDEDSVDELINEQRKKELCFEGHRIFDITRRKKDLKRPVTSNSKVLEVKYPSWRFVLPISHQEMIANDSMIQNDGYEVY